MHEFLPQQTRIYPSCIDAILPIQKPIILIKIKIEKDCALLQLDQITNLEPLVATVSVSIAHICNHDYCNSFESSLTIACCLSTVHQTRKKHKSAQHGINLSGSQDKAHSHHLQYPDAVKSSTNDLSFLTYRCALSQLEVDHYSSDPPIATS